MELLPQVHNRIKLKQSFQDFRDQRLTFSVSSRRIRPGVDLLDYLHIYFTYCDFGQIESVFGGTTQFSRLYGGRLAPAEYQLTALQIARLEESGIHLALTLTNHYFDEAAYRESWKLLEAHHKPGNSIVCTNNQLARRLRQDFPLYEIKASIIKNINTHEKIKRALDLYDSVVLPMDKNDDDDFLIRLPEKERILLFGNANCAYTCPARTCYLGFSQAIFGKPVTSLECSQIRLPRLDLGFVFFDVKKLADLGFTRFKMIPVVSKKAEEACRVLSRKNNYPLKALQARKPVYSLCSYPKSGRTWLRFMLANYLNLHFKLGLEMTLHSYFSLLPNRDHDPLKGMDTYNFPADKRFPLLLSSHEEYTAQKFPVAESSRIIFLVRSTPDVLVSYYFQCSRVLKVFDGTLQAFLRDPQFGLERYCRYLNSWASFLLGGEVLILSYERLAREPQQALEALLPFLKIPVETDLAQEAVRLAAFELMQALEKQSGMPHQDPSQEDPEAQRMRKGQVGGSLEYLEPADLLYIRSTSAELLSEAAKTLLQEHQLWQSADQAGSR